MDLSFLVGKTITHYDPTTNGLAGRQVVKTKWLVIGAYPHYVRAVRTCENGYIVTECFCLGELVQMGLLTSDKHRHYERNEPGARFGYKWNGKESK